MILLDTTVLAYAVGTDHRFRDPCRRLVEAAADGLLEASTTPEVIQEFIHIRSRRRDRADSARLGLSYCSLLTPLVTVTEEHLREGIGLYERFPGPGAFDSVLAAVAIGTGSALVSADAAFGRVTGLDHVLPDDTGVDAILA